jgi:hypothetical protein
MLRRVALVRTDVSKKLSASFIRVTAKKYYLVFLRSVSRLLVRANVVPGSLILVTLMKEALSSSETSVLKRATRRNIPEDTILPFNYLNNDSKVPKYINLSRRYVGHQYPDISNYCILFHLPAALVRYPSLFFPSFRMHINTIGL